MYFLQRDEDCEFKFCIFSNNKYKLATTWQPHPSIEGFISAADCTPFILHLIME